MNKKRTVLCLTLCLLAAAWLPAVAADADPVQGIAGEAGDILLNPGWQYLANPATDPAALAEGAWHAVDLPHTWNALDAVDAEPGYRRDTGWYRKWLRIAEPAEGMRYLLYFESANMKADVFINGHHAGGHVGGYLGFTLDVTELLDLQADNQVLVRVDNGVDRNLIPSQKSDFVLYGGITRDVFLQLRPASYIRRVQIDTPRVSAAAGNLKITTELAGDDAILGQGQLRLTVHAPDGSVVSRSSKDITGGSVEIEMPPVESPLLWSPAAPNLYRLSAELLDRSGRVIHLQEESFGFRWYEFSNAGDFMLNGERLLLRGTHRHEEHAAYGAAMPNALHLRDMEMIKEIGANFVRLGHYPQDPEVYRAADRLGLILWDELPWCRGGMGETAWQQNTESMLHEMITQNRNHPSVFFWSLGNEIYWQPDFEGGGDEARLNEYLAHLNAIAHELDPDRPTSIRKYYAGSDIVDVFSPSIWAGWYGGGYHQYADALTDAQAKYPRLLHMEYGASSHVGRYDPAPPGGEGMSGGQTSVAEMVNQTGVVSVAKYGDWSESYAVDLFDWHLKVSESQPHFGGNAQWAFKDFATPLRPENPIPYMNQKGLVDRAGRPKEAYWVFKSRWTTDPLFCHLFGQGWTQRSGEKDQVHQVRAYCNTEAAKLIVNGEEKGVRQRNHDKFPASGLFWDITLREGVNQLEVTGLVDGNAVATDRLEVSYSTEKIGKLADIRLQQTLQEDGAIRITALAVDRNGRLVQDSRERVYFSHVNPGSGGRLRAAQGTPDGSAVIEMANGKAEIIFDPAGHGDVPAVIEVRTQNHKGSYIEIDRNADRHGAGQRGHQRRTGPHRYSGGRGDGPAGPDCDGCKQRKKPGRYPRLLLRG